MLGCKLNHVSKSGPWPRFSGMAPHIIIVLYEWKVENTTGRHEIIYYWTHYEHENTKRIQTSAKAPLHDPKVSR